MRHATTLAKDGRQHRVYVYVESGTIKSVCLAGDLLEIQDKLSPLHRRHLEKKFNAKLSMAKETRGPQTN